MEFLPTAFDHEALDYRPPRRQTAPVVVASPHSGSVYPARFLAQTAVPLAALRRAEDAFVDELFSAAPALGIPFLAARFPRSFVDANREPYELDPGMFEGPLPRPLNHRTTRVAAGLGMIPRVAASGEAIYRGRVPSEEIEHRLETCWRPITRPCRPWSSNPPAVRHGASDRCPFHARLRRRASAHASATIASISCWATITANPARPTSSTAPSAGSPTMG